MSFKHVPHLPLARSSTRVFAAVTVSILALEAVAALLLSDVGRHSVLGSDGSDYETYAHNLVQHNVFSASPTAPFFPSVYRTPGYPFFLAAIHFVVGSWSLTAVRVTQFALLGLTAWCVLLIGRRLFDEGTGRLGCLFCLTYLPLVWLARAHMTEIVAATLATIIVLLLVIACSSDSPAPLRMCLVLGVVLAVATLVRPDYAGLLVIAVVALIARGNRAGSRAASAHRALVMILGFLVVVAPWAIRNYSLTHQDIPLGTASGDTLLYAALEWSGAISPRTLPSDSRTFTMAQLRALATVHTIPGESYDGRAEDELLQPTAVQVDYLTRDVTSARIQFALSAAETRAAGHVISHAGLGSVLSRLPSMLFYSWGTADEPNSPADYAIWHPIAQAQYAVLVLLFVAGLAWARRQWRGRFWRTAWPLLFFAIYETAVHLIFSVDERYTVPTRPVLLLFSAAGVRVIWVRAKRSRDARPLTRTPAR